MHRTISRLILSLTSTAAFAQGPLTPPPDYHPAIGFVNALDSGGAPQPTMKTLYQVEPRQAIPTGTTSGTTGVVESLDGAYTISLPGSYYLTQTIYSGANYVITIDAPNVTLDLNGFGILSPERVPALGIGINITANGTGCTIKNGSIRGKTTHTGSAAPFAFVASGFEYGVYVDAPGVIIENVQASYCGKDGIRVTKFIGNGLQASRIMGCVAYGNAGYGIVSNGVVQNCVTSRNGSAGILGGVVSDCVADENNGGGIDGGAVQNSMANANGGMGISSSAAVSNCRSASNYDYGIIARTVSHSSASGTRKRPDGTNGIGIQASAASSCRADANEGEGIVAKAVNQCVADYNQRDGIKAEKGTVTACHGSNNGWAGIAVFGGQVSDSTAIANGGDGIFAPFASVTACKTSDNTRWGIYADHAVVVQCNVTTNNTLNNPLYGGIYCDDSVVSHCFSKNNFVIQYQTGSGATLDTNR